MVIVCLGVCDCGCDCGCVCDFACPCAQQTPAALAAVATIIANFAITRIARSLIFPPRCIFVKLIDRPYFTWSRTPARHKAGPGKSLAGAGLIKVTQPSA